MEILESNNNLLNKIMRSVFEELSSRLTEQRALNSFPLG